MLNDIAWDKIKKEYVMSDITTAQLADKWGLSASAVQKKCSKDKWKAERKKCYRTNAKKIITKASEKLQSRVSEKLCKGLEKELRAADLLSDAIIKFAEDKQQFNRHLIQMHEKGAEQHDGEWFQTDRRWVEEHIFNKGDAKSLQAMVNALAQVESTKRKIMGIMTTLEKERLAIEKERLAMEKAKVIAPTEETSAGIAYMPSVDLEAYEAEKEAYLKSLEGGQDE